jgi:hypothetical protein
METMFGSMVVCLSSGRNLWLLLQPVLLPWIGVPVRAPTLSNVTFATLSDVTTATLSDVTFATLSDATHSPRTRPGRIVRMPIDRNRLITTGEIVLLLLVRSLRRLDNNIMAKKAHFN